MRITVSLLYDYARTLPEFRHRCQMVPDWRQRPSLRHRAKRASELNPQRPRRTLHPLFGRAQIRPAERFQSFKEKELPLEARAFKHAAVAGLCLLAAAGCATLPDTDALLERHTAQAVRFENARGPLSAKQNVAVLEA